MREPHAHRVRPPVLRVASHNVRGLLPAGDSTAKVGQLMHLWAIQLQLDVVLLQEPHCHAHQRDWSIGVIPF